MKKLVLGLGLLVLNSCGYRTPIIDGNKPFIVAEIKKYSNTHSVYTAQDDESGVWTNNFEHSPRIALPSGMYNIGDTIQIFKNK